MIEDFLNATQPPPVVTLFLVCGLVILAFFPRRKRAARKAKAKDPLDAVLYQWGEQDSLTVRHLLAGGISILGATGSGKSSALKLILAAIMRYGNSSMLLLCSKPGDRAEYEALAEKCGRSDDVVVFAKDQPHRLNLIGYEAEKSSDTSSVVRFIMTARSIAFRESDQGGGDAAFWSKQDERALTHAVNILKMAGEEITPVNLHNFVMSAPQSMEQFKNDAWEKLYCGCCIRKAFERQKNSVEEHDFKRALDFWGTEWAQMADRTRSSIKTGIMATLSTLGTGLAREMFANKTTLTPAQAMRFRKIVIVDWTPDEHGDLGRIANIGMKIHWQNDILRRNETMPISVIVGDEASLWVTPCDAAFLSRCRSHGGAMIYACQSLANYREALPGERALQAIKAIMGNFKSRLFFSLSDYETAEDAANLVGKELTTFMGGGVQTPAFDVFKIGHKPPASNSSFSQSYEYIMQPAEFMNGLRTGGGINEFKVDAILVRGGESFSNGYPVMRVTFDQRDA